MGVLPLSGDTEGDRPDLCVLLSTCSVLRGPPASWPAGPWAPVSRGLSWPGAAPGACFGVGVGEAARWLPRGSLGSSLLETLK